MGLFDVGHATSTGHPREYEANTSKGRDMRKILGRVLWSAAVVLLSACANGVNVVGSGKVKSETRAVSGFDKVVLSGIGELSIEQAGAESLTIEAEDNILPLLESTVSGGTLMLGVKDNTSIQTTKPIQYRLTVKNLRALTVSGAGRASMPMLSTDTLALRVSGSGGVNLSGLTATSLTVGISGSGGVTLDGQVLSQDVTLTGSGTYAARDLASGAATVTVSGSGNATVSVQSTLDARISGSGSVTYFGSPTVTQRVTGSGAVRHG